MTAVTADFDNDGWPDIFLACDSTPSLLLMNNHDGTFRSKRDLTGVWPSAGTALSRLAWVWGLAISHLLATPVC